MGTKGKRGKHPRTKTAEKKQRATQDLKEQRITEVLQMRLAGAQWHDIREHARATWKGGASDAQLHKYIEWSNEAIAKARDKDRERRINLGLARRESIYANCVRGGDFGTALSTLKDIATLEGHYPEKGQPHHAGNNTYINISLDERQRRMAAIAAELGIDGLLEAPAQAEAEGDFTAAGDDAGPGEGGRREGSGTAGAHAAAT